MSAQDLPIKRVEKIWGRNPLPPPFALPGDEERIGEIWFEPSDAMPDVLVKYLFTSEKLSVQVHPADAASPTGRGKEECWLVLDAEPGARLAMGFKHSVDADAMRAAALDGSIEDLLEWRAVEPGDFFYIPAGTVHAIGEGLTLLEVQQNTDITYRLYDYGRPRELHLDAAIEVASGEPYPAGLHRKVAPDAEAVLVDGPHFRLFQLHGVPSANILGRLNGAIQVLPLSGDVAVSSARIAPGSSAMASGIDEVEFGTAARTLIACSAEQS
ncbi:mannose-6-phosphate isomerase [Erythrobacter gaetbuli]|uniref:Mannose-6-phosphate isomerase n=1 Tax=Qipengyuania gaetbuli TaxID=266952 RepID=A0A844Y2Q5_9SPHN|nr:class I mannose-6-phosphate isomerase [Qipengyuania gaetbuli]MXO52314.1 mannose-6-phosphate isomerase [Qipengyuania gaetbuli]